MKKIFFTFCLVAISIATFTSCNKDAVQKASIPVSSISKYSNGNEFMQFEYNSDSTVKKVTVKSELSTAGEATDFLVVYNNDKSIKELTTTNEDKIVPAYTNGLLTKADIVRHDRKVAFTNYNYENNKLRDITIYFIEEERNIPVLQFKFSYNNAGNISETVTMMADGADGKLTYAGSNKMDYSTNINPLYQHNDLLILFWQPVSKNNVRTESVYNKKNVVLAKNSYVYSYQNNEYKKIEL